MRLPRMRSKILRIKYIKESHLHDLVPNQNLTNMELPKSSINYEQHQCLIEKCGILIQKLPTSEP